MRTILIANRGEIACRIARSCRSLGLRTIAVYSEADCGGLHVAAADEAVLIGPAPSRQSYLDQDRILSVARERGADAVHPGYGFLSENGDFAQAVVSAGLTWIGPEPEIIRAMGDKQRAREIATRSGVPVVPGSRRFGPEDLDGLEAAADAVGYPLLIKAVGGGGGIGMRRIDDPALLKPAVAAVQALAARSFGQGGVFLERLVRSARHVEVQVFGFGDGEAIHLFERECSIQRRYQKVIEESPAPGLPADLRGEMARVAVTLAHAVRYGGVGTVEFIVDAERSAFYFLEMNTRIQVEHPVTEMITGLDLVAMQIELASGSPTRLSQDAVRACGHAVECRLYAENPARGFLPSPGQLAVFAPGPLDGHVRLETGYRAGDTVTPHYDPLLAKLIAWGETRSRALDRLRDALRAFRVEGVATNRDLLLACLDHPGLRQGRIDTRFIERHHAELVPARQS